MAHYVEFAAPRTSREGIALEWRPIRAVLSIWGWYDSVIGIEGGELTLVDLANLGVPIDKEALDKATKKEATQ